MKFLSEINRDYLVVGASIIIISVCSVLLYADFSRKMEAGGATRIGTITYKHKVTQRKYASQVVWEDVEHNTPVFNNDSIRTSELSEAIVNLSDGTKINIDENSLIMLAFTGKGISIDFSHGTITANRRDFKEQESPGISIQSKNAVVSLDKGDVKLTSTGGKELDVTVTEGKAEIKTEKVEKTIRKDEKAVVTKDAGATIVALKLKLKSPSHNDTFVAAAPGIPVDFTWEPVDNGAAVYLDMARSADFTIRAVTRKVAKNSYTENLGEGSYYWRIRALNKITNVQELSDVRKINIIRDQPVVLIRPRNDETISYRLNAPIINFRWEKNSLASDYILEISSDPAFKSTAVSLATPLVDLSIDRLQAGTYYWRVKTKNAGVSSYGGVSPVSRFQINRIAAVNPPALILPPDGKRVSASMLEKGRSFMFSWTSDNQIRQYDLMIARDTEFRDVAIRVRTSGNFHAVRESLKPGQYYWRVGAVPEESEKEVFSSSNSLLIIPTGTVTLGDPRVEGVTAEWPDERRVAIRFPWEAVNFKGTSRLELSRDRAFLNIFSASATAENYGVINGIPAGAYYWRVRLIDDDRNQIAESDGRSLYISTAGGIVGSADEIMPKAENVDIAGKESEHKKKEEETRKIERDDMAKKENELAKEKESERDRIREEERVRIQKKIQQGKQEELARKQQEEIARKKQEEQLRKEREELARRNEIESARKQQEEQARRIEEESARKKREELVEKEKRDKIRLAEFNKYKEKRPGRRLRWKSNLASTIMSRPVCRNNIIIATTKNGFLVGLNMNGGRLWRTALGSATRSTPAADTAAAYVVTVDGTLYSIDLRSGAVNWKKSVVGPLLFGCEPAVDDNLIFVATSYGMVQAFSSKGTEVWRHNLEEGIFSSITVSEGTLYVGTDRSKIYAMNARDGRVRWTFNTDGRIFISSPKVYRGTLFVGCYSGTFFAVDARSGRLRWKFKANKSVLSTPAFHGRVVYFGSEEGTVYALDISDGGKLWEFSTKRPIIAGADVFGDSLLIPSGSTLYSIDMVSGDLNWKEGLASGINTPVTVVGNTAYVGLDNGEVVSVSSF
jgi:outer membrane protein assembly factor BamB